MDRDSESLDLGLSIADKERFLALFYEPVELDVNRRTECRLSVLRIENGAFILDRLYTEISNLSLCYALPREEVKSILNDKNMAANIMEATNRVKSMFQKPNDTNGEGGELLLYALLEAVTGAPKLLTKMPLKTNSELPVFGSDGVHLLKIGDNKYQLIFCESKMYSDLNSGISAAFKSLSEGGGNSFDRDRELVHANLMKEVASEKEIEFLERILVPPPASHLATPQTAYGVFLAFDIEIGDYSIEDHDDAEIEKEYRSRAKKAVEDGIPLIQKKIKDCDFGATPLHIFAMPFLNSKENKHHRGVSSVRRKIQEKLRFGEVKGD